MKRRLLGICVAVIFALGAPSMTAAHQMPTSSVLLDIGSNHISGEVDLPLDRLSFALGQPLTPAIATGPKRGWLERYIRAHMQVVGKDGQVWAISVGHGRIQVINGFPDFVASLRFTPPDHRPTPFTLHYGVIIDELATHRAFLIVRSQRDGGTVRRHAQALGIFQWDRRAIAVQTHADSPLYAFTSMVSMGIHHIAEGSDHLLFLLTLLLPAPLIVRRKRWTSSSSAGRAVRRIFHVVSAFAVGHSMTLAAAAFGLVHVPARPIEVLIALSIAVSAVHAMRPLVHGGEAKIAFFFGLVHGLAFAEVLSGLGLRGSDLVVSLLGFNLGIELTQLLVVALIMPSFWLLSTTPFYAKMRLGVAGFAFVAAGAWMLERATVIATNPIGPVVDDLISHPFLLAVGIACVAIALHWRAPDRLECTPAQGVIPSS